MTPADPRGLVLDGHDVLGIEPTPLPAPLPADPPRQKWKLVDYDNLLVLEGGDSFPIAWLPANVRDIIRQALRDAQHNRRND